MKSPGSLLDRNGKARGVHVILEERGEDTLDREVYDPLSPSFVIPQWLLDKPTPWNLVCYWEECLQHTIAEGENRNLVHGTKGGLRPAKKLLSQCGPDLAARVVCYTAQNVSCQVTLHRALDRVDTVREAIGHTGIEG